MRDSQKIANDWVVKCFGQESSHPKVRGKRVAEEAIELAQACGVSKEEVLSLVNYNYSKEPGTIKEELSDTIFTLLALAEPLDVNLEHSIQQALMKIKSKPIEYWQQRALNKKNNRVL